MLVAGYWETDEEGRTRPLVDANVGCADGTMVADAFLLDSGADRTVFSAGLLARLNMQTQTSSDSDLYGIGGSVESVLLTTIVEFTCKAGGPARVRGEFAAFTQPEATDVSILGRDVLDIFDVIISRRREEVLLLSPNHQYHVKTS